MSYVRTNNDEIYKYTTDFDEYIIATTNGMEGISIKKTDIIKEADTIIDLCDGVLVEEKDNPNKWFIMKVEEFKMTSLDKMMIKCFNFKAFIKTDKGLIYVGEMNSEGKLELCKD